MDVYSAQNEHLTVPALAVWTMSFVFVFSMARRRWNRSSDFVHLCSGSNGWRRQIKIKINQYKFTHKIEFHPNVFEDWRQLMVRSLLPSHCARFAIVLFSLKTYLIAQNICYVLNSLILWHYWVAVSKSILYLIDTDLYSIDFVTFPRLLSSSVLALVWFSAHFSVWYRVSRTCEYFSIHKDKIN